MKTCRYCKTEIPESEDHFKVRRARLPKHRRNRFVTEGFCCLKCESKGEIVVYDSWGATPDSKRMVKGKRLT